MFAFTSVANRKFKHGVPRAQRPSPSLSSSFAGRRLGCRFSIIAWGRRRTLTRANAGAEEPLSGGSSSGPGGGSAGSDEWAPIEAGLPPRRVDRAEGKSTNHGRNQANRRPNAEAPNTGAPSGGVALSVVLKEQLDQNKGHDQENKRVDVRPSELVEQLIALKRRAAVGALRRAADADAGEAAGPAGGQRRERRRQRKPAPGGLR